ncbi:MAG: guanylate kinase, partial [Atopobium sp.]|nr:guanylate kinase [Atopobium sp.]
QSVVLEIDVQGGLMVHKQYPNAILVFIKPPSFEELEQRLRGRGTEDEKTISTRLSNASREMEHANDYTVCIVNDNLETALSKLEEVFDDYESDGGQL